jgi:uncharacterized protein (TIGR03435 family)
MGALTSARIQVRGEPRNLTRQTARQFHIGCSRLLAAAFWILSALPVNAQSAPAAPASADTRTGYLPTLTFDVASIRESPPANSITVRFENPAHSSVIRFTNVRVMDLIVIAYGLGYYSIAGGPDWARGTLYMIEARSDSSADEKLAHLSDENARLEKQHMLQVLVADRFQLKTHWIKKEGTNYALVQSKKGHKLSTSLVPPSADEIARFGDHPVPPLYQRGDGRLGYQFIAHGCSMKMLADMLTGQMDAPVADQTGLAATYDFTLQYNGTLPGTGSSDPAAWAPLITALPEQLGLRLEPVKGPVQILSIDHIEKPTAN